MRRAFVLVLVALLVVGVVGTALAEPPNNRGVEGSEGARCLREVIALGLLGSTINPGNHRFVGGTDGLDYFETNEAGRALCSFGSSDYLVYNFGLYLGGDGRDLAYQNEGLYFGGDGNDQITHNFGTFDGGPGYDVVTFNYGTCLNVEWGC